LWNHTLSTNTFTWDDATTTGGTNYATITPTYKGPTVKCLSCHDGSVAIGDANMYKESKAVFNTYKIGDDGMTAKVIGKAGALGGNHPVAMPYPYLQAANTYNSVTTGANVPLTEFVSNPVGTNGTNIKLYKVNGGAGGTIHCRCRCRLKWN